MLIWVGNGPTGLQAYTYFSWLKISLSKAAVKTESNAL